MGKKTLALCLMLLLAIGGLPSIAFADEGLAANADSSLDTASSVESEFAACEGVSLTSAGIPVTAIHIGESVELSAIIDGDATGILYNYVWSKDGSWDSDSWSSTVRVDGKPTADTSWEFWPASSGSYDLYVDVIFPDGHTTTERASLIVEEDWAYLDLIVSDASIELGESVDVSPRVSGIDARHACFNYVWRYGDGWSFWSSTVKETGSSTSDASWRFTPSRAGSYTLYVDAIDTNGVVQTRSVDLTVTSTWSASGEGLAVSAPVVSFGEPLELSVSLDSGSNDFGLAYNFGWQYETGWELWDSLLKQGSTTTSSSHSFVLPKAGTYRVFVDIIGTDGRKLTLSKLVTVTLPYSYQGVSVSSTSMELEESVTVEPMVAGDTSGVTYNYVWSRNGSWAAGEWGSTVKSTGAPTGNTVYTFTPAMPGVYTLYIDVNAPDGTKATRQAVVTVDRGWTASDIRTNLASPQKVGASISYGVEVNGNRASKIKFNYVWSRNGSWAKGEWGSTVASSGGYTADVTGSFVPGKSGAYVLYIDAYDTVSGEKLTFEKAFQIDKTWRLDSLDIEYSAPLRPGASVTWRPKVLGEAEGLSYNFVWSRNSWDSWNSTVLATGSMTASPSVTYEVSALSGTFDFYVDVTDQNGETETAQVTGIRGYSADANRALLFSVASKERGPSSGFKYENALLNWGGTLCNNRHGWWCATLLWWCFKEANLLELWGEENHLQSDPEWLAFDYSKSGNYYSDVKGVRAGDIIYSYWAPWRAGQNITHASLVTKVTSSTIVVFEGNISGGVSYNVYDRNWWRWRGYSRPQY